MKISFLGTGAADWFEPDPTKNGEYRRFTSTLFDGHVLIDVTPTVLEQFDDLAAVTDVLFTHSHYDHYNPGALQVLAPCRVYAHESWAKDISGDGLEVIPLKFGEPVTFGEYTVTALPSNHSTDRPGEKTAHYLIRKGEEMILYATDGGWLRNEEHHALSGKVLDAVIFDATVGDGHEGDFRVFEHNSLDMVRIMTASLRKMGRLKENAPVFLTHMARTLHPDQAAIEKQIAAPFVACYDGLTVTVGENA